MFAPLKIFVTASGTDGNAPLTDGIAVTGSNTYYSKTWSGLDTDGAAATLMWTGTPNGTLTLWMTDKPNYSEADDSDWVQDTSFSPTNPAGSASKMRDDTSNAKAFRKRIKYVNSSSSGTLFGYVTVPRFR